MLRRKRKTGNVFRRRINMWALESVFYQIYPLGFCGAPQKNDGVLKNRILKVLNITDHLKEIGIDAVLFNPLFDSDVHGYDIRHYGEWIKRNLIHSFHILRRSLLSID